MILIALVCAVAHFIGYMTTMAVTRPAQFGIAVGLVVLALLNLGML